MELQRLSACTYAVREQDLDYTFAVIRNAGFCNVDLWGGPPNYSNDPDECDHAALKTKAAEYGLQIANLGTYPGRRLLEVGDDVEFVEMQRAIDIAADLGARSIRATPGTGEDPGIIPGLIPFFQRSAAYAQTRNVFLGIENHAGNIAGNPDHCMELVQNVGSDYFGVIYEPANLMHGNVDYKDAYAAFRGSITHVHVKDSHWIDGVYERTMLGDGDIDYEWVAAHLAEDGYDGHYALEYEIEDRIPIEEGLPQWLASFQAVGSA